MTVGPVTVDGTTYQAAVTIDDQTGADGHGTVYLHRRRADGSVADELVRDEHGVPVRLLWVWNLDVGSDATWRIDGTRGNPGSAWVVGRHDGAPYSYGDQQ